MSAEAWTFLGVAVTALAGIVVVIIQQRRQTAQLGSSSDEPTLRSLVKSVLEEFGQHRVDEAEYHAAQESAMEDLASEVAEVKDRVQDVEQHLSAAGFRPRGAH